MNTNFGTVTPDDCGYVVIEGDSAQLYDWAHRPGASWPCSTLTDYARVKAEVDTRNGDLVDLCCWLEGERYAEDSENVELDGSELTAWIDDCLTGTSFEHLRRFPAVS